MALYEITRTMITKLDETTFGSKAISERADLQRLLKEQIEVIAPDTLVIAEESASGTRVNGESIFWVWTAPRTLL